MMLCYLSGPVHLNIFSVANNQLSHVLSCNDSLMTFRVMTICSPAKLIFITVPSGPSQLGEILLWMLTVCQIKHSCCTLCHFAGVFAWEFWWIRQYLWVAPGPGKWSAEKLWPAFWDAAAKVAAVYLFDLFKKTLK